MKRLNGNWNENRKSENAETENAEQNSSNLVKNGTAKINKLNSRTENEIEDETVNEIALKKMVQLYYNGYLISKTKQRKKSKRHQQNKSENKN